MGLGLFRNSVTGFLSLALFLGGSAVGKPPGRRVHFKLPANLTAEAEKQFRTTLRALLDDEGTGALTWSNLDPLPGWLALDKTAEILQGTPALTDAGSSSFRLAVQDQDTGDVAKITMTVIVIPVWTESPINLGKLPEKVFFQRALKDSVTFKGSGGLTFTVAEADPQNPKKPAWLALSTAGVLSGTPQKADAGPFGRFVVVATANVGGGAARVEVFGEVVPNHAPKWTVDPVLLPDALTGTLYSQELKPFVTDDDGDPLTFKLVNGPAWAKLSSDGTFSGTPAKSDIGTGAWSVEVSDGRDVATATIKVKVVKANEPPVWAANPVVLPNAKEDSIYNQNLKGFASDPDQDPLTFTKVSGPDWLTINADGSVTGTPRGKDRGKNNFQVKVADGKAGDATTEVQIFVDSTNHGPEWNPNPVRFNVAEKQAFSKDIAPFASDPDTGETSTLKFAKISGPQWLSVSQSGVLSGTPPADSIGENAAVVRADDGKAGTADVNVIIVVDNVNDKPFWSEPIILPNALEKSQYTFDFAPFGKDPDAGDSLEYSKVKGPAWASVSPLGAFEGTPQKQDIGANSFTIRITDKGGLFADVVVQVQVEKLNTPPHWLNDPISLPSGVEGTPYVAPSLATFAVDDDKDALTFTLVSGPAWLKVASDGKLSGTPGESDIGDNKYVFEVSDGKATAKTNATIAVVMKNYLPEVKQDNLTFTVNEKETLKEKLNDPKYVSDKNGDNLVFTLIDSKAWVTLSSNGDLFLTPGHGDIGTYSLKFKVGDGKGETTAFLNIEVKRKASLPVWSEDPIRFTATSGKAFSKTVATFASDVDGMPLTFSKSGGPAWLLVDDKGKLTGTPLDADVGENTFTVLAKNDGAEASVTVIVNVIQGNKPPVWSQDPITLPDGTAGDAYKQSVASFAMDPEGKALTFSKVSGPDWIKVATSGELIGTPDLTNAGLNTFKVRASDPESDFADVEVRITVTKPNHPPKPEDPVQLPPAYTTIEFGFDLKTKVTDEDGDILTFKLKNCTCNWMSVAVDGTITGTPKAIDIGDYTAVFEVSDGKSAIEFGGLGTVYRKNEPPVIDDKNLVFAVKERSTFVQNINQPGMVTDPDGDPLTFQLVDQASWADLSKDGVLTLKPLHEHLGDHPFRFKASDGKLSTQGIIKVTVVRDLAAPIWSENPIRFKATAKQPFSATVADKVKDVDNLPLEFASSTAPAWLTVSKGGGLTGTPLEADLNDNEFMVKAFNAEGAFSEAKVIVTVVTDNKPPVWLKDPIPLPDAKSNTTYSESVAPFAKDPEGEALKFEKISGPEWAFLTTEGMVIGTPTESDAGVNTIGVRVKDPKGAFADATAQVVVGTSGGNHAPKWNKNPIDLGSIKMDTAFTLAISGCAVVEDGDPLVFTLKEGPTWLSLSQKGVLTGTPKLKDLGKFTAAFVVSDGKAQATANAFGEVVDGTNKPPQILSLNFTVKERTTLTENINQAKYVIDPEGDPISFLLVDTSDWVDLTDKGVLTLTPRHEHIGNRTFKVKVSDDKGNTTEGALQVTVTADPIPPKWDHDPLKYEATVDQAFSVNVSVYAKDPDGGPLTFSKVSGPAWLSVNTDGTLSGTPKLADLGPNTFSVRASNTGAHADVTVLIEVKKAADTVDTWQVDKAVPGATSENVWVVDNSWPWIGQNWLINELKRNIGVFFRALDDAQIHYSDVYLSSDPDKWKGLPVKDAAGEELITWKNTDPVKSFQDRLDRTKVKKTWNSPIWAMFLFYQQAPGLGIYHNGFFTERVPNDVFAVTSHTDAYAHFTKNTAQSSWTASEFADSFMAFHQKEKQPYRISALAPECPKLMDPNPEEGRKSRENPYRTLVQKTKGTYYAYDCNIKLDQILSDYAKKVIFRAYVGANSKVPLSKKPSDAKTIKVSIGNVPIPGNTGGAKDLWYYDANRNEVVIRWELMDMSTIQPGDLVKVEYKT